MNLTIERWGRVVVVENIERADLDNPEHVKTIIEGIRETLANIAAWDAWVDKHCDCSCRMPMHSSSCYVSEHEDEFQAPHRQKSAGA